MFTSAFLQPCHNWTSSTPSREWKVESGAAVTDSLESLPMVNRNLTEIWLEFSETERKYKGLYWFLYMRCLMVL